MTAVSPPDTLHVVAPASQQAAAPVVQETPAQQPAAAVSPQQPPAPPVRQTPPEERTLTTEETRRLLRGEDISQPEQQTAREDDQSAAVQAFFGETPAPPLPQAPPVQLTPEQMTQAVQQTQVLQQPPAAPQQPYQVPVQAPAQVSPEVAALTAQVQMLQNHIQLMGQQQPAPQQAQAPAPQQPAQPEQGQYNFVVPDNYMNALAHEDINVRRAALNSMLNGVAEAVSGNVRQQMEQMRAQVPAMVQPVLQARDQAQQIQNDLYGTYPELRGAEHIVKMAAQQVAMQNPQVNVANWSPDLRDAIAERAAAFVPGLHAKVQSNRAQRVAMRPQQFATPQAPQYFQPPQPGYGLPPVPQQPYPIVPPQAPAQPVGPQGSTLYTKDGYGNLVPFQPQQQYVAGQQTRPVAQYVDPKLQDIWTTLNF